jgi:predicted nucleic acid-binding protein
VRLAADANVLLSAILGHAALCAIDEGKVEPVTTLTTLAEVEEHLPALAEMTGLDQATLKENLETLGIISYGQRKYQKRLPLARRLIEARDPDDVPLLALALTLKLPIWTNDRDFEVAGIETYTTAQLLAKLGIRGREKSDSTQRSVTPSPGGIQ